MCNFLRYPMFCAGLMLFATSCFAGKPASVSVTGIFSSLKFNEEGGDLLGEEFFVFFASGYHVLYQEAMGETSTSSLAFSDVKDNAITFTVQDRDGQKNTFRGKITKDALVGSWNGSKDVTSFKRKNSYWQ